jgi:hypothetical protein
MFPENAAHVHLLFNHVPVIGFGFGLLITIFGIASKSKNGVRAGLIIFFVAALFTIPTYLSGEGAEEIVETIAGTDHALIHAHEEAALWAMIFIQLTGALALGGLLFSKRWRSPRHPLVLVTLGLALLAALTVLRVNNLGGVIHHPEIHGGYVAAPESETEDDDR